MVRDVVTLLGGKGCAIRIYRHHKTSADKDAVLAYYCKVGVLYSPKHQVEDLLF